MPATPALTRLFSNALWLSIGGVLAQVAFVSVEALIARRIGVDAYGVFAAVYAGALLLVHTLDMGMNWKMLQDGSREPALLADDFGTIVLAKIILFLLAYPLVLGLMWVGGASNVLIGAFAVFAFFALSMMLQDVFATVFTAHQRMAVNAAFQAAVPLAMLLAVLVIVTPQPTLPRAVAACVIGSLFVTSVWAIVTARVVRPTVSMRRIASIVRQSFHYGVSVTVHALYFRLGVLTLIVLRSATEVALFAAAYKLLELGFKIPTLATRVVAPKLFADAIHRPADFRLHAALVLRVTALMSALMGLALFLAGPSLLTLVFGKPFAASGPLAQILAVSLALKSVALLAQTVLSTADEHLYRARADLATTVAGVLFVVVLTAAWGATGTAIAVACGDLVWSLLMVRRCTRHLPDGHGHGMVFLPLAAAAIAGGAALLLPLGTLSATLVAVTIFGALLLASGHLRPLIDYAMQALPGVRLGRA